MKTIHVVLAGLMATMPLMACSSPSGPGGETTQAAAPMPASNPESSQVGEAMTKRASATGTVEAIDLAARTITIAHGPVPELGWPAMTMTFKAPDIALARFKPGDEIAFDLSASGMAATVTAISVRD